MILISQSVYKVIDDYTYYLIKEGLTSVDRSIQKRKEITQAIYSSLGSILTHRPSPY